MVNRGTLAWGGMLVEAILPKMSGLWRCYVSSDEATPGLAKSSSPSARPYRRA
jgi:hypothetical protein